ncbi:MAG: hypothetical protein GY898_10650 [Proteobacteria bacterium]|nr:hypothetical protein [Pseudomonadota bacterium]
MEPSGLPEAAQTTSSEPVAAFLTTCTPVPGRSTTAGLAEVRLPEVIP